MKKDIKAQAALEFLTTYGWAFLVILIMISALAYFGVLKPSKLLPDRCSFGAEIGCQDYMLDLSGDQVLLRLKNNLAEVITVDSFNLSAETQTLFECDTRPTVTNWKTGEILDLTFSTCNFAATGMQKGEKGKVLVTLTYYSVKAGSPYKHDVQGEIYATVK